MESRPLDIKLMSAKDLKDVNVFSKMDVYAVVSLSDGQTFKTPVDKDCGKNPKWNFTMKFTLPETSLQSNNLTLLIKLKHDRTLGSDKDIGFVHVSCKELFDQMQKAEKVVAYAVRTPSGRSKGSLELSYQFGEKYTVETTATAATPHKGFGNEEPVTAYPAPAGYPGLGPSNSAPYGYHGAAPPGQYPYQAPGAPGGYPYPPPLQQQPGYGYQAHPPQQYGAAPGYGHHPPGPYGGYPMGAPPPKKGKSKMGKLGGAGLGLGLAGGLLGGMLVGEMISDTVEAVGDVGELMSGATDAVYDAGVDAALDAVDFGF